MNKDEFRKHGYQFIDWIADYYEEVQKYPVRSQVQPDAIKKQIPETPPISGEPMEKLFEDFKEIILPGITHWQHPGWFAYFPANTSPPSILGEILTAGLGSQCMIWQTSPAAAELEERMMEWLRMMLQLPEGWEGVIHDTASTATLCALLTARERATNFESNQSGMRKEMTVYASEEAHSSVEKDVKIAGYGKQYLRYIPADAAFALLPEKLEDMIRQDKRKGYMPACVIATVGTTSSAGIDPLEAIGQICCAEKVWLHVDAAYAGTAAILPKKRWILNGIEHADSFVFNPHKWMFTNFDCSAYFVKDPGALIRTFEIHPEYLKTGRDAQVKNFRDWGIQLGRRFRALKLWFVIRYYGVEQLQSMIREHIRLAQLFKEWIEKEPGFEVMAPVHLSLVCFRINDGRKENELNELNKSLMEQINDTGKIFLTHTTLKGKYVLRLAVGQRMTQESHVQNAWEIIRKCAKSIL
ncbi:MAG: amino acid decarboxylase [Candidatus Fischerbacteria bacterium RBG_13_37_8]|uniref:Amino acid decarboxylase n=1 Tax=Candidatus Fischerbacteria bacterium RBG_13_37_8 TaxID=1817863 RepID=A0A1F5VNV4_9BACT|nr:MAG: amino acid decarboxylase [Candidatus Fischerbacteria bacterium RBG_13_37_8]